MSELSGTRSRLAASMAMLLDKREVQILRRLCDGCSCCAIGQELGMAERTVRYAITRACRKLGVERRAEALRKAGRLGLLDT